MLLDQQKMAGEWWESQEAAEAYFQGNVGQVLQNVGVSLGQPDTFTVYNVIAR